MHISKSVIFTSEKYQKCYFTSEKYQLLDDFRFVYNKKKIQIFVMNMTFILSREVKIIIYFIRGEVMKMTFISSREVKKYIFHSWLRRSWNIYFVTSLDEIKVIFMTQIGIFSIYLLPDYLSIVNFTDFTKIPTWRLIRRRGWLGRSMVLGSFQCRGVLLLWHIVGQGPAVLVAGAGWVGCFLCVCVCFFFHLVYPIFPFLMPHLLGDDWT